MLRFFPFSFSSIHQQSVVLWVKRQHVILTFYWALIANLGLLNNSIQWNVIKFLPLFSVAKWCDVMHSLRKKFWITKFFGWEVNIHFQCFFNLWRMKGAYKNIQEGTDQNALPANPLVAEHLRILRADISNIGTFSSSQNHWQTFDKQHMCSYLCSFIADPHIRIILDQTDPS